MAEVDGVLVGLKPPEDWVVDIENPVRNSVATAYSVVAVGLTLSTLFVAQRLYVKGVLRGTLGTDDAILVMAYFGSVAIQALVVRSFAEVYMGLHGWEIPLERFQTFSLFAGYINSIVYTIPTTLSKIVILLFYRDINNHTLWYRTTVYIVMFIVGGAGIAILFCSAFPCHPVSKSWDLSFPLDEGWCIDKPAMYQATAGIGVATDVLIFAIPIPLIVGLHMSVAKKIGLIGMFAIGSVTVITSMVRLKLLISSLDDEDQTWGGGPVSVWICVEANLLIMCACLSTIRHFFKAIAPRLVSSSDPNSNSKKPSRATSGNHELRTFGAGSSRNRAYYNRFDETDVGMDTVIGVQGLPPADGKLSDMNTKASHEDAGSDKAIIQTKETHVYYEYPR